MVRNETEAQLIEKAQSGDPRAIEALVRLWGPRVRRFASRLCPVTEALDAAQESLLILSTRFGSLRSADAVVSWTFQIVKRQCVKVFSRVRRDTALARELGYRNPEAVMPSIDRRGWLEVLGQVLATLPERDQQVLILRDLEALPLAEAARRLGITETATKSRLHRARALLRERMLASPLTKALPEW